MSEPVKHFTSTVYIFSDTTPRKTLLVHHKKSGLWTPPGGHLETDENPLQAAIREVKEETGLDVSEYLGRPEPVGSKSCYLPLPRFMLEAPVPAHGDEPQHYHLDLQYSVTIPEQAVTHQDDESHDIGWFTLDEATQLPAFEDVHEVLKRELNS